MSRKQNSEGDCPDIRAGQLGWGNPKRELVVVGNTQRKIDKA